MNTIDPTTFTVYRVEKQTGNRIPWRGPFFTEQEALAHAKRMARYWPRKVYRFEVAVTPAQEAQS